MSESESEVERRLLCRDDGDDTSGRDADGESSSGFGSGSGDDDDDARRRRKHRRWVCNAETAEEFAAEARDYSAAAVGALLQAVFDARSPAVSAAVRRTAHFRASPLLSALSARRRRRRAAVCALLCAAAAVAWWLLWVSAGARCLFAPTAADAAALGCRAVVRREVLAGRAAPSALLHAACTSRDAALVAWLLRAPGGGASDVNARDSRGETPLHVAARTGAVAVLDALFETGAADVNARSNAGLTPLQVASTFEAIAVLKAHGASTVNQ